MASDPALGVGGHAYQVRTVSHTEPPHRADGVHTETPPTPLPSQKCRLALTPLPTLSHPSLILDPPGSPQEGLGGEKTC